VRAFAQRRARHAATFIDLHWRRLSNDHLSEDGKTIRSVIDITGYPASRPPGH
jgi:hypothetical protein